MPGMGREPHIMSKNLNLIKVLTQSNSVATGSCFFSVQIHKKSIKHIINFVNKKHNI